MAFRGTFDYTLDAKNRLTVPAKFRATLGRDVVLAAAIEPCVQIWTPEGYDAYTNRSLEGVHTLAREFRQLSRFFSANSHDLEIDSAGRVMVPAFLLEHAGLTKEVVVTGSGDCVEVWDKARWSEYNGELLRGIAEITDAFGHPA